MTTDPENAHRTGSTRSCWRNRRWAHSAMGAIGGWDRIRLGMELILNLGWALLAAFMIGLWLRYGPREGASRRTQVLALGLLLVILFPVISVSDDLQSLNNPAEIDTSVRRIHVAASPHSILPAVVAFLQPLGGELSLDAPRFAVLDRTILPTKDHPGLAAIENRPPPSVL